jgi:hypothetical protein
MYKTIFFSVVLYECETWSLTLRDEHTLKVLGREGTWIEEKLGDKRLKKTA